MPISSGRNCGTRRRSSPGSEAIMVRSVAWAAVIGVVVAAGAAYAVSRQDWRNFMPAWLGMSETTSGATLATEDWPICTTMASLDVVEGLDPDFAAGKKALAAAN